MVRSSNHRWLYAGAAGGVEVALAVTLAALVVGGDAGGGPARLVTGCLLAASPVCCWAFWRALTAATDVERSAAADA
ncbi:MAG TPA: hypothetical protein VFH45_02610, partial [Acidimicrobiales bacterium]|nr:hypothetical protein [Acidimicrobiales bacterium]